MRPAEAYADLSRMDRPIVTTREAATRWRTERGTAGRRLRTLEEAGLLRRLRRGLWALDPDIEPFVAAPFLTAPFPAYVSFWSALSRHGMIEQIPRQVSVASLDRARQINTTIGVYDVHHLSAEVFGGFRGSEGRGYLAAPEKAVFDTVYVRAASGSAAFFPELALPEDFDRTVLEGWAVRIKAPRLRTIVSRDLRRALGQASSKPRRTARLSRLG
jgi:predicted transcriptional regulator of viral defense system